MFNVAEAWGVRPSELAQVQGSYEAYCFDQAIASLGQGISARLNALGQTDKKTKSLEAKMQRELAKILQLPEGNRYRSPTITKGR